jgi:hypothetical protein
MSDGQSGLNSVSKPVLDGIDSADQTVASQRLKLEGTIWVTSDDLRELQRAGQLHQIGDQPYVVVEGVVRLVRVITPLINW